MNTTEDLPTTPTEDDAWDEHLEALAEPKNDAPEFISEDLADFVAAGMDDSW